jgi:hypothetical protein
MGITNSRISSDLERALFDVVRPPGRFVPRNSTLRDQSVQLRQDQNRNADASPETCDGRPQMRARVVPELQDPAVPVERGLHDAPLHTAPAAMDDPHLEDARVRGRADVLINDRRNICRGE